MKGIENFEDAYSVRKAVFVIEQDIDEELEIDINDERSNHLVIYDNEMPIATGRLFLDKDGFHIGRLCVLKKYRSRQLGKKVMEILIEKAILEGAEKIYLSSQLYATGFYRKFGFREYGDTYNDAGIEHISMVLRTCDIK
ncbi:GNAT family N-acetyltransferase [Methanolobus bombayensis]|uniref:GNAT family N-acetyltransferase n=1 Tax=Methanolobus bombayensis TaxID=38023 RepID=UPI001AE41554|nr:GNAT family N-acetyltransferase [Methanolobus bombayensis]MBP1908979.1 putative GNAT family N-acyltransferase [Methanolobus bombayensis]